MKTRFSTIDIRASIAELNQRFLGMRVYNCYDIDNRTYLIRLAKPDLKAVIVLESGNRIYSTDFDWPKNTMPSGFSIKLRKHLRTRRLEAVTQLGADRIVDLQFGSGEAAYHIILELYDRGNIVLTDHEYSILNILRQRTDESQDVRFAVREKYPLELAKQHEGAPPMDRIQSLLLSGQKGDNLKKILNPHLVYGPGLIEHCLLEAGFPNNARLGHEFNISQDSEKLLSALQKAEEYYTQTGEGKCKGYIIQKKEKKASVQAGESGELLTYNEFHPFLFKQHQNLPNVEFETFNMAVDEFFSQMESQKLDMKVLQQEKAALKKLDNVKKDHEKRIHFLQTEQERDAQKAQLIEINLQLVDQAIRVIQSALANQIDWTEIWGIVKEAQAQGDPVASSIKGLKLDTNHFTMLLKEPFEEEISDDDEDDNDERLKPMKVDIDLSLTAYSNARKYYDQKRFAAKKEQKTLDASSKALKSAEKKTKETLKEVAVTATINKTRKTHWFEKFLWFISSENYLVIGGRDQQQNELIVKRYLRAGDLYVHADLHGASSVIIKSKTGEAIPPKTLTEAGTMAVCNSAAWDAKVVTSAWWVHHDQVSKTAPTGEYLSTGSFMIRGKKNYLPPCYLVYGFGFIFKLDEDSYFRHKDERRVRTAEEDAMSVAESTTESEMTQGSEETADFSDGDEGDKDEEEDNDDNNDAEAEGVEVKQEPDQENEGETLEKKVEDPETPEVKAEAEESSSEEESLFPDTSIDLQHVKGDKFTLQRNVSTISSTAGEEGEDDPYKIYLGDDNPINLKDIQKPEKGGAKMSAKQRREMKKRKQRQQQNSEGDEDNCNQEEEVSEATTEEAVTSRVKPEGDVSERVQNQASQSEGPNSTSRPASGKQKEKQKVDPQLQQQQAQQPKRGQKGKLKKIKEKYKDQDEEERNLKMEILASAGGHKKKGKKGRQQQKEEEYQAKQAAKQQQQHKQQQKKPRGPVTIDDIRVDTLTLANSKDHKPQNDNQTEDTGADSDDEKQAVLEEENLQGVQDTDFLDSLTGLPVTDDTLLYCIPVCAPYSCLNNYKYKAKLTPGNTKRGKAAKVAVNMFMHDKTTTSREKELFKSLKDVDVSRNIPGKVKLSAPNLHKHKHK